MLIESPCTPEMMVLIPVGRHVCHAVEKSRGGRASSCFYKSTNPGHHRLVVYGMVFPSVYLMLMSLAQRMDDIRCPGLTLR